MVSTPVLPVDTEKFTNTCKVWKGQSDCTVPALPKENCPTAYRKVNDASKIPDLKQCHFQLKGRKTHTQTNKQKNPRYCSSFRLSVPTMSHKV